MPSRRSRLREDDAAIAPYFDLDTLPVAWVRGSTPSCLRPWDGGAVKIGARSPRATRSPASASSTSRARSG